MGIICTSLNFLFYSFQIEEKSELLKTICMEITCLEILDSNIWVIRLKNKWVTAYPNGYFHLFSRRYSSYITSWMQDKKKHIMIKNNGTVQTFNFISAPVDQMSASAWLEKHPWITCHQISQAHQWHTQLVNQSYIRLWGHLCNHAQETGWQSGMQLCISHGCPHI